MLTDRQLPPQVLEETLRGLEPTGDEPHESRIPRSARCGFAASTWEADDCGKKQDIYGLRRLDAQW